jgi:hypothetical protein
MLAMIGAVWSEGGRRRCNRISARALATAFGSEASTFMKRTAPPIMTRSVSVLDRGIGARCIPFARSPAGIQNTFRDLVHRARC